MYGRKFRVTVFQGKDQGLSSGYVAFKVAVEYLEHSS